MIEIFEQILLLLKFRSPQLTIAARSTKILMIDFSRYTLQVFGAEQIQALIATVDPLILQQLRG